MNKPDMLNKVKQLLSEKKAKCIMCKFLDKDDKRLCRLYMKNIDEIQDDCEEGKTEINEGEKNEKEQIS